MYEVREHDGTTTYSGLGGWVTNNPEAAAKLRAADNRYELAKVCASGLTLGGKIEAYRIAREARQVEYDAIFAASAA